MRLWLTFRIYRRSILDGTVVSYDLHRARQTNPVWIAFNINQIVMGMEAEAKRWRDGKDHHSNPR